MLSNGRRFADREYAAGLAQVRHPDFMVGIPLYSDVASHHDFVVQAIGAFDQTMVGFHNLARYGVRIEVRIVVHKQTYERLPKLAEYIYRNLPFVEHIAFMGLEMMGYTKTNLKTLWIDPFDYQDVLEEAVSRLALPGMNVSIYNHQLCVLRRPLWRFARKSISDFKNIYLDACQECAVLEDCGGLFKSGEQIHSQHISALLGLVVQVRGSEYVRKDLRFNVKIKLGNAERVHHGFWRGIGHSRTDRVAAAVTTDWWIDLDRIFTSGDIASVCRVHVPTAVSVELVDYSFSE